MRTVTRKTELSPLEAIVVEGTLGEEARKNAQTGALARIQQLTRERQKLYARSVGRPMLGPANAARIRAISAEIEMLWELLRRERATRRVQLERALNVVSEDNDDSNDDSNDGDDGSDNESQRASVSSSNPSSSRSSRSSRASRKSRKSSDSTDAA
jgi:hypothetical protein